MVGRRGTPEERFLAKVDVRGEDECWPWLGYCQSSGHPRFGIAKGKTVSANRFAYELWVEPIPEGLGILHSCDNPPCCNPKHLRPGTQKQNTADWLERQGHHNSRKTTCKHGHPLTQGHYYLVSGRRVCKACALLRQKRKRNK